MILLSPANSTETALAAYEVGADAVYVGVGGWGLRPTMFEPGFSDVEQIIRQAHERGKELYVCLNIRLAPAESKALLRDVERLVKAGVDALIMADAGLISAVHSKFPELPIHASVQCAVVNAEGALFFADLGCKTVIISRSITSPDEIRSIVERVNGRVDIEVFAHGDICYNLDGICYLTGYMHREPVSDSVRRPETLYIGNSNRGECSLVCKQECALSNEKGGERRGLLLRRADLSTLDILPDLVRTGVKILKIEGRQFPIEYVRTVTSVYREALDLCLADPDNYRPEPKWHEQTMSFLKTRDTSYSFQRAAWQARKENES